MDTQTPVQRAADAAYRAMERRTRDDGTTYYAVKDGAPEWIKDAIKDAHDGGNILPDDWTYARAHSAFECISEADDPEDARHEWADAEVDTYNSERIAWLSSYPGAVAAVDEAQEELGPADDLIGAIGLGQYFAAGRIFDAILAACEAFLKLDRARLVPAEPDALEAATGDTRR